MEFGLGEADVYDLDCKKLRIETGMSEVVLNSCTASDSAEIECGMSDIDFKDCTFNMCSFDIGMSDLDYSGSITGESSFDGGMCEYDFELDGNRSDYYIKGADGKEVRKGGLVISPVELDSLIRALNEF